MLARRLFTWTATTNASEARAGRLDAGTVQHVRVGQHYGSSPPPALDDLGGAGGQGDQRMRGGDQDVLLLGMGGGVAVVGVA